MLSDLSIDAFLIAFYGLIAEAGKVANIIKGFFSALPTWCLTLVALSFCMIVLTVLFKHIIT